MVTRFGLSKELGVGRHVIERHAEKLGLSFDRHSHRKLTEEEIESLRESIRSEIKGPKPCPECGGYGHSENTCPTSEKPRRCSHCGESKPRNEFYTIKDGRGERISGTVCKRCVIDKQQKKYQTEPYYRASRLLSEARRRAEVTLTTEDILEKLEEQNWKCFYSGRPMTVKGGFNGFSIDRKNNEDRRYTKENVVLCLWGVNEMKSDIPFDEFIRLCKLVRDRHAKG